MRAAHAAALVLLAGSLACRGPRPEGGAASCTHVQAERQAYGAALCEDVWTCARPPEGPFDRLGLHRLALCENATGPVVLYLPGMHMSGELPISEPRHDLRVYLAAAGVRTWGLDYRTHVVPADAPPVPGFPAAAAALADPLHAAQRCGAPGALATPRGGFPGGRPLPPLPPGYDRGGPRAPPAAGPPPRPSRTLPVLAFASTGLGPE